MSVSNIKRRTESKMSTTEQDSSGISLFLESLKHYNLSKLIQHLLHSKAVTDEEARTMVHLKRAGTLANLQLLLTIPNRRKQIINEIEKFIRSACETSMKLLNLVSCNLSLPTSTINAMYPSPQSLPVAHMQSGSISDESSSDGSASNEMEVDHPAANISQPDEFFCRGVDNVQGQLYNPNATADSGFATQDLSTYSQQSQPVNKLIVNHNSITVVQIQAQNTHQVPGQRMYPERQGFYEETSTPLSRQNKIFGACKPHFLNLVNIQTLEPLLSSNGWLTPQESQELQLLSLTELDKKEKLFRIIPTKTQNYIEQFVRILRLEEQHKGHEELANILDNLYWGKKIETQL